ncbi:hypothetical protein GCM10007304_04690 [Rhodococcoides trifolii]|uniref:Lumazine-binding protein n=1 Tax=Rhodococcoides trifolii TaxID=908250 RepID=A0A917CNX2_9NOCA|nr:nuclear transport factor 2 family protein [Rhodococcus trifolii]GGF93955.1 hypothetical protein GCM10007304_04690 [Rhodococcus trifolii]
MADDPDRAHASSSTPILAALVIAVLLIVGVVLVSVFRPADQNVSENDRVGTAVTRYVDARNDGNLADVLCSPTASQPFSSENGEMKLKTIDAIAVDGAVATADITAEFGGEDIEGQMTFTKSGDDWKVCDPA